MACTSRTPAPRHLGLVGIAAAALAVGLSGSAAASTSARAAATPKKGGVYSGRTDQNLPVRLTVSRTGRKLTGRVKEELDCGQFGFTEDNEPFTATISRTGRVGGSYSHEQDMPDEPSIGQGDLTARFQHDMKARFSNRSRTGIWRTITGVWHTHAEILDGTGAKVADCDTDLLPFVARLRR